MRPILACCVSVAIAAATPRSAGADSAIWCGTSVERYRDADPQAVPPSRVALHVRGARVEQVDDYRARPVLERAIDAATCPRAGTWTVTLVVDPTGTVLASTARGEPSKPTVASAVHGGPTVLASTARDERDATCILSRVRLARFEPGEVRTITARVIVGK